MCLVYGIAHEFFTWAIRQEPGVVVEAFERVYDTPDLLVFSDGVNVAFPNRADLPSNKPWPHQDQDPEKPRLPCLQESVDVFDNGDDDGGGEPGGSGEEEGGVRKYEKHDVLAGCDACGWHPDHEGWRAVSV